MGKWYKGEKGYERRDVSSLESTEVGMATSVITKRRPKQIHQKGREGREETWIFYKFFSHFFRLMFFRNEVRFKSPRSNRLQAFRNPMSHRTFSSLEVVLLTLEMMKLMGKSWFHIPFIGGSQEACSRQYLLWERKNLQGWDSDWL